MVSEAGQAPGELALAPQAEVLILQEDSEVQDSDPAPDLDQVQEDLAVQDSAEVASGRVLGLDLQAQDQAAAALIHQEALEDPDSDQAPGLGLQVQEDLAVQDSAEVASGRVLDLGLQAQDQAAVALILQGALEDQDSDPAPVLDLQAQDQAAVALIHQEALEDPDSDQALGLGLQVLEDLAVQDSEGVVSGPVLGQGLQAQDHLAVAALILQEDLADQDSDPVPGLGVQVQEGLGDRVSEGVGSGQAPDLDLGLQGQVLVAVDLADQDLAEVDLVLAPGQGHLPGLGLGQVAVALIPML